MFPSTNFQSRLSTMVDDANKRMHCGDDCTCPMQLRYSEYMMGEHVLCDVVLRISGYVYLFVEGRFMENGVFLTIVNNNKKQQFMINDINDAENMCDVIEQYVDTYLTRLVDAYQSA